MSLLAAFEETVKSIPDAVLLIAGGNIGTDRDPVEKGIEDRGLQGRAVCLGTLQEEQIIDFLAAVDIVVLPKLDDPVNWAGMSTKLGEYLAAGRALVATRVGDAGEALNDGVNALLVNAGDPKEMASAIARLLENDALRQRLGGQARQLAEQQFSARTWVSRLVAQLEMAGEGTGEGQK
jgi:glycosyltransferase involved in cell wall biosynthesis